MCMLLGKYLHVVEMIHYRPCCSQLPLEQLGMTADTGTVWSFVPALRFVQSLNTKLSPQPVTLRYHVSRG